SEATGSSTLLSSRNITIGSWNVRTLYQTGKTAQVAAEMRNYNLALLGVSETRWTQTGQRRLLSGEMLLFSGHEEDNAPHTEGVALMLSRSAQSALIGWEAHGPRIITASFRTKKKIKMNVIQCYAPTNDSDEENKDQFYNRLQTIIDKIHKATWVSPDHVTENQIDHICIGKTFRRSLQDVRVKRGADAASDHHLLVAILKLKLKKNRMETAVKRKKYNVSFLKDAQTREEYRLKLTNRFQVLQELLEEETDLNKQWQNIKETWTSTCQEVVGPRTPQQKEWISVETLRKVQMRKEKKTAVNNSRTRTAKAKAQEEYAEVNREVKKSIKVDKRNYIDSLAEEAEQAAGRGNMKELYDTTRKLSGKYCHPERPVKDKEGNAIIGNEQQLDRWAEHFEELLNRPAP
ncbi:hypothetical protein LSAT2_000182, partial [Lamellibrachia satsuma]